MPCSRCGSRCAACVSARRRARSRWNSSSYPIVYLDPSMRELRGSVSEVGAMPRSPALRARANRSPAPAAGRASAPGLHEIAVNRGVVNGLLAYGCECGRIESAAARACSAGWQGTLMGCASRSPAAHGACPPPPAGTPARRARSRTRRAARAKRSARRAAPGRFGRSGRTTRWPSCEAPVAVGNPIDCHGAGARAMTTTTTTTTEATLLTADDLLRLYGEGVRGELIRGVLCETMPTGQEHGEIVVNLSAALWNFVNPRRLGRLTASDSGVWLERDPDTVREPDIAFTSAEKIPLDARITGYAEVAPDLVVEVASPGDSRREVHDKAHMWINHGVRLVWVVQPETRTVDVYRPGGEVATLGEQDALDGLEVLPGFACEVSAVFGPQAAEKESAAE
ncbi:MAG: Uma2 family endonuclease [Acidimicrobiia bacterium]|nr:Uma2 family endonuclease [Acidimicrobiia bacterium]